MHDALKHLFREEHNACQERHKDFQRLEATLPLKVDDLVKWMKIDPYRLIQCASIAADKEGIPWYSFLLTLHDFYVVKGSQENWERKNREDEGSIGA